MSRTERTVIIPSPAIFAAVDVLVGAAPESVHVMPELLVDEIVRSAFYPQRYGINHPSHAWPGVIVMGYGSIAAEVYIDLLSELVGEAARSWSSELQYRDVNRGDLLDYAACRGAQAIVLRVRDYGR